MKLTDEVLMAYADGELDEQTRAAVDEAMRGDPEIAERVAQHRALRSDLHAAFRGVLEEPVPGRLLDAANSPPRAAVADLATARAAKQNAPARRWAWKEWTAIAASVLMGVLVGRTLLESPESELVAMSGDDLVATGGLADALSNQIGAARPDANVTIVASFQAKSGEYCRAFTANAPESLAGIACRREDAWRVHTLTQRAASSNASYRMAASTLPAVVLQTVESMMVGDALDAEQEAAARARGWERQE